MPASVSLIQMLSGDLDSNDVDGNDFELLDWLDFIALWDEPTWAENCYHVVTGSGTDATAGIDGVIITGGRAPSEPTSHETEGSIEGCPTVINVTFVANLAMTGGGMYNYGQYKGRNSKLINCTFVGNWSVLGGAGVFNSTGSSPTLIDCTFRENTADASAGMYNSDWSAPTLINCTFSKNVGGGVHNNKDSNPTLTDCLFSDNGGAGMWNSLGSSPTLTNCSFIGNLGGGLSGGDGTVIGCTFIGNYRGNGGAVDVAGAGRLIDCIFIGNVAERYGGAVHISIGSPALINCTFIGNYAKRAGGAIYMHKSAPILANCILSGNKAKHWGGGIYSIESSPTLTNCTFAANSSANGNALACGPVPLEPPRGNSNLHLGNCILRDGGSEIWNDDGSTIAITYTNLEGGWPGDGNIDKDPCAGRYRR